MYYDPSSTSWPWARSITLGLHVRVRLPARRLPRHLRAVLLAVGGLRFRGLRRFVRPGLFLAVTLAIGPGVIVNGVLKPSIGRPRPKEVVPVRRPHPLRSPGLLPLRRRQEPGGRQRLVPLGARLDGVLLHSPRGAALPPAEAAGGCGPRLRPQSFGAIVGAARVVQGAHFVSDVIGSALFVYLSVLVTHLAFEWADRGPTRGCAPAHAAGRARRLLLLHCRMKPPREEQQVA